MKKYLLTTLFALIFASGAHAIMLDDSILQGKVKSFDGKEVIVVDGQGQEHHVKRSEIPPSTTVEQGKEISIHRKVSPKMFKFSNLPYKLENINKMSLSTVRELHRAYTIFVLTLDKQMKADGTMDKNQKDANNRVSQIFQCLLDSAYADEPAAPAQFNCFYAGWPTPRFSNANLGCQPPWNTAVMASAEADFKYTKCGAPNAYRCNPVLFGQGRASETEVGAAVTVPGTSVQVRPTSHPENGLCVVASQHDDIIKNCLKATAPDLGKIIKGIKDHPENFNRFAESVKTFCQNAHNRGNGACTELGDRLATIQFGQKASQKKTVAASTACTALDKGDFMQNYGVEAQAATCPRRTCFVKASCPTTEGASEEITAVCPCGQLGVTGATAVPDTLENGQIVACINDTSIDAINPAPVSEGNHLNNNSVTH